MKRIKKFISLITTISILMANAVVPTTIYAVADTPDTPLYLFRDTMENYATVTSNRPVMGVWDSSVVFNGTDNLSTYGIYTEDYSNQNKVIGITPGRLGVLNLVKNLGDVENYVYSVDIKVSDNISGIRLSHNTNECSYYELAIVPDSSSIKARFSKVSDATTDTPSTSEKWQYADYGNFENLTSDSWLTLSLAIKDGTLYWSVYNSITSELLSGGSYTDTSPLFTGRGRLQLFAYNPNDSDVLTLFDNVDAKKLGAEIYKDSNSVKLEVSWINSTNNEPIIAVADYDEQGRVLGIQTYFSSVSDGQLSKGDSRYLLCDTPPINLVFTKKLFVWGKKNLQPVFSSDIYEFDSLENAIGNFAILENYSGGKATLLLSDGTNATYGLRFGTGALTETQIISMLSSAKTKSNIQDRVVNYCIVGDEVILYALPTGTKRSLTNVRYNPHTGKIGSVTVDEVDDYINASTYAGDISEYTIFNPSDFKTQTEYSAYVYKATAADSFYSLAILTDIGVTFTEELGESGGFAVLVANISQRKTPDGEDAYGADAFYNGEETVLYWKNIPDLSQGDAIFFTTDEDGFVNSNYPVIYDKDATNGIPAFAASLKAGVDYEPLDWAFDFDSSTADIRLVHGYITDITYSSITFGVADADGNINFNNEETDITSTVTSGLFTYGIADGCNAYEYDSQALGKESSKYGITDPSAIYISELVETSAGVYSVTDPDSTVTNAVALIVNGDVVCIYAIY